ncbi:IPT/TIG domain-containing protein [Streptomyces sp. NPDC046197]|uniref:IPT/TIG domain-containing protein n=1 Tax=Streptomyces sp. NPDC046197 TaxID=3154337 RepID=UPI00340D1AC4
MPPVVSSISPAQGPASGGTTVTITGSGLTGATAVRFGSANATTFTVTSSTSITAVTPAGSPGSVAVTVVSPTGTSNATVFYTYTAALPSVTGLSPATGPTGGGTTVVLTGTNFSGATAVRFGSVNATSFTVTSSTSITAVSPAGAAGAVPVTVTTPSGTSAASPDAYFFYAPIPLLLALSPGQGPESGNNTVTVTGQNLANATDVRFGGTAATFTATATAVTAVAPAGTGTVDVTVTTPGGASNPLAYAYVGVATLTGVSPSSGPTTPGTVVTLTGTGLTTTTSVRIGGVGVGFVVLSDTRLTATVPAGPVGAASVQVMTAAGTSGTVTYQRVATPGL